MPLWLGDGISSREHAVTGRERTNDTLSQELENLGRLYE